MPERHRHSQWPAVANFEPNRLYATVTFRCSSAPRIDARNLPKNGTLEVQYLHQTPRDLRGWNALKYREAAECVVSGPGRLGTPRRCFVKLKMSAKCAAVSVFVLGTILSSFTSRIRFLACSTLPRMKKHSRFPILINTEVLRVGIGGLSVE